MQLNSRAPHSSNNGPCDTGITCTKFRETLICKTLIYLNKTQNKRPNDENQISKTNRSSLLCLPSAADLPWEAKCLSRKSLVPPVCQRKIYNATFMHSLFSAIQL